MFHESPLLLLVYSVLEPVLVNYSILAFILLDLLTCFVLCTVGEKVALALLDAQKQNKEELHPEAGSILISSKLVTTLPKHMAIFYLLNPFLLLNCAARTSTVWNSLLVVLVLLGQVRRSRLLGSIALSLAAYQTLYPIILLFPLCISFS